MRSFVVKKIRSGHAETARSLLPVTFEYFQRLITGIVSRAIYYDLITTEILLKVRIFRDRTLFVKDGLLVVTMMDGRSRARASSKRNTPRCYILTGGGSEYDPTCLGWNLPFERS
ncbi:hypothetical protein TcasGA2_TC001283 [Tribolium castaneum]|uniref:Uncharacterized protein n=1 Tax=Tribolium castaneum TaxID=7070 RepID=D6WBG1_TRICA|nr:hypothetical protein TcasGA2_TC001283 [Tribolium castaneum]